MSDVTPQHEKQIEQLQPKVEGAAEANVKLASAKDLSSDTVLAESRSENEKLKLQTSSRIDSGTSEARIQSAHDASAKVDFRSIDSVAVQDKTGKPTVWESSPIERGRAYEEQGGEHRGQLPVIDDFQKDGVATNKTLDLNSETFIKMMPNHWSDLEGKVNGFTDKLSSFNGRLWHQEGKAIEVAAA
jgi:hypothetical protein